ncbi:tyrosine recombinase XerC [Kitasatospora sp. CB02891]|uniref:site-specific integrase n=1 Tax=Kitasatospora sp. CB02891 TaxID=2020329 RepID=UPI000C277440|nr:tyrosine-type recombinase/integrase [Kitasatospora sp. CB02891]PJN22394.1 site-specific integrase [Kitasatospora sp. CB02891]
MSAARRGGGVYKRCECRGDDGKLLGSSCPSLVRKNHGSPAIRQELPVASSGSRRTFRRTGFASVKDAQDALDEVRAVLALVKDDDQDAQQRVGDLLAGVAKNRGPIPSPEEVKRRLGVGIPLDGKMTVAEWLDTWFASKKTRKTTNNGYESHIRVHLKPHLGHLRLDRLNAGHLQEMFDAIADENEVITAENQARREQVARCRASRPGAPTAEEAIRLAAEKDRLAEMKPFRRITGAATRQRIRSTLRAALNVAIARKLITHNPAEHLEMVSGKRPKALLWTPPRVEQWKKTGEKPSPVMVWTLPQLGEFLDAAEEHRLYPIYHLIAFRGLRRGEAVGQDEANVDLEDATITVAKEIVQDGWTPIETEPKTDGSAATIALDSVTVQVLREHRVRKAAERAGVLRARRDYLSAGGDLATAPAWIESGKEFTTETGSWLHPDVVSAEFEKLRVAASLPPINLRDLRHQAATVIHAGGGDLHAIKETLRHSTIRLASDTYTSLLPEVDREVAERAAGVVPRARRRPAPEPAAGREPSDAPVASPPAG